MCIRATISHINEAKLLFDCMRTNVGLEKGKSRCRRRASTRHRKLKNHQIKVIVSLLNCWKLLRNMQAWRTLNEWTQIVPLFSVRRKKTLCFVFHPKLESGASRQRHFKRIKQNPSQRKNGYDHQNFMLLEFEIAWAHVRFGLDHETAELRKEMKKPPLNCSAPTEYWTSDKVTGAIPRLFMI